jgi:hypothetical protein
MMYIILFARGELFLPHSILVTGSAFSATANVHRSKKEELMSPQLIFPVNLVLGYVAWLLYFGTYIWPRLKSMDSVRAQRAIATLHSFRFFGLVFLVPGVVGPHLPAGFAASAAYGDFATALLAFLALLLVRVRQLFWVFVIAFNTLGTIDLLLNYRNAVMTGVGAMPGELGGAFVIPVIIVPALMVTHIAAYYLLIRSGLGTYRSAKESSDSLAVPSGLNQPC